jgi:hypothetical protein
MNDTIITRSEGTPLVMGGAFYGMAGGGYTGITGELDAVVAQAAEMLAAAYGQAVEIRFNSDRESGGAWLRTRDGGNAETGIGASLITARSRASWLRSAEQCERMAETGLQYWDGRPATADQREGARECAAHDRELLAECPEGQLTVYAHITGRAALPELRAELAGLPGWNDMSGRPDNRRDTGYHHGPAGSVEAALARCLRFVPAAA